jgi:hypothetical protein
MGASARAVSARLGQRSLSVPDGSVSASRGESAHAGCTRPTLDTMSHTSATGLTHDPVAPTIFSGLQMNMNS